MYWKSIWQSAKGLFQIDTDYSSACIKQVKPCSIEELSDSLAIIRSKHKDTYIKEKTAKKILLKGFFMGLHCKNIRYRRISRTIY